MAFYTATVSTDGSGDGDNLDSNNNPVWSGKFKGLLLGVKFDFSGSAASTADTTLSEVSGFTRTIASLTDSNTDTQFYPQVQATDSGGSGITGVYQHMLVDSSNLKVVIAQGGTSITDAVIVIIQVTDL